MRKHCEDIKDEIVDLLCKRIDETLWRCGCEIEIAGFCSTVRVRDYLAQKVMFQVEEAGIGMPTHFDVSNALKRLYNHLPPDLEPETIESFVFVRTPSSPVDVVMHFKKAGADPVGETNDRWYVQPVAVTSERRVLALPRPKLSFPLVEPPPLPSPQAEVDPGEPIPVYQTGVWKVTSRT